MQNQIPSRSILVGLLIFVTIACILTGCSGSAENKPTDPLIEQVEKMISEEGNAGIAQAFSTLHHASADKNDVLIPWLKLKDGNISAPFMMELGSRLLSQNPTEGVRWYMVGHIRASYDAQRCTYPADSSQAINVLIRAYPNVLEYIMSHPQAYTIGIKQAVLWEKAHPYSASPAWICSHTTQAFQEHSEPLIRPSKEWPTIYSTNLADFEAIPSKLEALSKLEASSNKE